MLRLDRTINKENYQMAKKANLKEVKNLLVEKINDDKKYKNITLENYEYLPESYKVEMLREVRSDNKGNMDIWRAVARLIQSLNTKKY